MKRYDNGDVKHAMARDVVALALLRGCFEAWSGGMRLQELRRELREAKERSLQQERKLKQLEERLLEEEWSFEAERFMARSSEQLVVQRDVAMLEREELRLELAAQRLLSQATEMELRAFGALE